MTNVPVIDLFAGPGGLGEGFCSLQGDDAGFRLALSIEKDPIAHRTLLLRAFFRKFEKDKLPEDYYRYVRGELASLEELFDLHPSQAGLARREARCIELGSSQASDSVVDDVIAGISRDSEQWVLVGGPPCQAYSVSNQFRRVKPDEQEFGSDARHRLYEHYLRILARHGPTVFVMENVKGLLSLKNESERLLDSLLLDLERPCSRVKKTILADAPNPPESGYRLYSLRLGESEPGLFDFAAGLRSADLVIRSEDHGIPQTRHRVFIFGVRSDFPHLPPRPLSRAPVVTLGEVIDDLPRLRSRLSREPDSAAAWAGAIREELRKLDDAGLPDLHRTVLKRAADILGSDLPTGGQFMSASPGPRVYRSWFVDSKLAGVLNHEARGQRRDDLLRYLYISTIAKITGRTVMLGKFPEELLPAHGSAVSAANQTDIHVAELLPTQGGAKQAVSRGLLDFNDRFRVQVADGPATTVTSHISKDGHYYIHPDPSQCRSLTVREAARIQTFPDNYFFEGMRTHQYMQVGNAVPPLLAKQIASIVYEVLVRENQCNSCTAEPGAAAATGG